MYSIPTYSTQSSHSRERTARNTSEDKRRRNAVSHQREVLKTYVRLALQKELDYRGRQRRSNASIQREDEDIVREWLKNLIREKKEKQSRTTNEVDERMIAKALESLEPHAEKLSEKTLAPYARTLLKVVPELPNQCRMLNRALRLSIKQVKYGEMETARAMAWHSYGRKVPSPVILSREHDLSEFESGRIVQSKPKKQRRKDKRVLRKGSRHDSMDEILAMSLVELTDRVMYCVKGTMLYSDQSTAVCQLDEFVGEVTRCAISLNPDLLEIVQNCIDVKMDKDELVFGLEKNERLISIIWGHCDNLKDWYQNVILIRRRGVINLLYGILHSDYGQFEVLGLRYTFTRREFSDQPLHAVPYYRDEANKLDREYMEWDENFKQSVYMKDGVLMKREPKAQTMLRIFLLIVYATAAIVTTVVVCVKFVKDGLVGYLEVISLVILGLIGTMVSVWQCMSSQSRPIRNAFRGYKEVHRIEDLLNISYLRMFEREKEKRLERFRMWLAGIGYGENLPGIDVFYSGKDRYPLYDPKGIRLDHLSRVTLCDGYFLMRRADERARMLMRHGDNLRVEDTCDGHAVVVSRSTRSTMRVGGD